MDVEGMEHLFKGAVVGKSSSGTSSGGLAEFQKAVIKVTKRLEFASLGSGKWLESTMMLLLVNGYSHLEQSHPDEKWQQQCIPMAQFSSQPTKSPEKSVF